MRIRMTARATDEPHRAASQLELLFDLTFVIAIASLTARYAHALADGHALEELVPFLQVFFAIWWAWINFTWFASSFDTDDVPYRLLTMVQMAGVLVIAAGVPAALEHGDFGAVALGYVIMRLGLVAQWLRVAVDDPASRGLALRYAIGITIAQVGLGAVARARRGRHLHDALLRSSRRSSSSSSPSRGGRSASGPAAGIRITSPSATASSRSSSSARACSPRRPAWTGRSPPGA